MFNLNLLKLDKREISENKNSFVGIRRGSNNELEFRLPRGFDDFPEGDFQATKKIFFRMYRTFKKFEDDRKSLNFDKFSASKDNIEVAENAYTFQDKEDNDVIIYSKISIIENLLNAYSDLALDIIERRNGRNEIIDYAKIDQYLHTATYLDDNVIYIDEMNLPRHFLNHQSATLIDLFCFILCELNNELEYETDDRVIELSKCFKEQYLTYEQSLFGEETFDTTIKILKDTLDDIDKITAYKDSDYWKLYEAIEMFLYGELDMNDTHEDGVFWGISNFHEIWEDMCNTYMFGYPDKYNIIYADTNIKLNGKRVANHSAGRVRIYKKNDFDNPFYIAFRAGKRWMRPDFIHFQKSKSLYDDIIGIHIINEHQNRLDFEIRQLNKEKLSSSEVKFYNCFCDQITKELRHFSGARKVNARRFNNYLTSSLDKVKKDVEKQYQKNHPNLYRLLDWKYMDSRDFTRSGTKIDVDITKQLCYELAIQSFYPNAQMNSQFVIPFFFNGQLKKEDELGIEMDKPELYGRINDAKIDVFKVNFEVIQEAYLANVG